MTVPSVSLPSVSLPSVSLPGVSRQSAGRAADAEALRIFLRLIRPRPLADPYPLYTRLRDMAPFLPIRFPGVRAAYLVSTFASCSRLLRDPAFGPPTYAQLDALNPGWRDNAFTRCLYRSMVFRAGPGHRERRQVAARHFTPRQIGKYRAELDEIASLLITRLAEHGTGPVDLVEQLALPFASLSLGRLARQIGAVFEQFATAEQHRVLAANGEELVRRLAAVVAGRRGGGQDNLLARLAESQAGADEQEQLGAAVLLFGAGFDSPASM